MEKIYIKTEYCESLSGQAFAALAGILLLSYKKSLSGELVFTSPLIVFSTLTGREPTVSDLQIVSKGFKDLIKIGVLKKYHKGYYVVDYSKIERTNENFTCLNEKEIRTILNSDAEVNNLSLLQYFALLKSTFDYETKTGNYSLPYYSTISGKNKLTILRYHRVLEQLGILKVFRFKPVRLPDGTVKKPKNIYCCPEDEKSALKYALSKGYSLRLKEDAAEDEDLEPDDSEK